MKPRLSLLAITLLLAILFVACGPSEEDQNATSTAVAASVFATQTAEAPTETPVPTNTATPTETPTPLPTDTPTPTPEPTETTATTLEPNAATDSGEALAAALPVLEDMPPGFQELPPEFMDFAMGSGAGEMFGPSAAFMDMANNVFVITVLSPLEADFQKALFEQQLEDPEVLVDMMGLGIAASGSDMPEFEYELLPGVDGVGDKAIGVRLALDAEGQSLSYDLVVIMRDEVGAIMGVIYSAGNEPSIDVLDLAQLVDGRIMELASDSSGG